MQPASEPGWQNRIEGNVDGNVVQARDIHNHFHGARPRKVSATRFVAADFAGRDAEIAEISRFCRGSEPYSWWLGVPWAGKTALAAHVVTSPPLDVDVVYFFISRADGVYRLADYFAALTYQLGTVSEDPDELWAAAAKRAADQGRSLLLVVDGLDENIGGDEPSIASQLPIDCPHGSHVLVTSRPHPELPDDVRANHPLLTCPRRTLVANDRAIASQRAANLDLREHLHDPGARRVLGLLAVARGPLTAEDLGAIVGNFYETGTLLSESMARILKPGYSFAHETLLATVAAKLGEHYLADRVAELHRWAERYRAWPDDTPAYVVDRYPHLLVETGDAERSAALCSASRFRLLRRLTGANYLAMRELLAAQAMQTQPRAAARLAMWIDVLRGEPYDPPVRLPGLLAQHGRVAEAEHLARSLVEPTDQARALIDVANAIGDGDDRKREVLAGVERLLNDRMYVDLMTVATALSSVELLDRAVQDAERIADGPERTWELAHCAWVAAALCPLEYVERIGAAAGGTDNIAAAMAAALARAGRIAEGQELVARVRADPEFDSSVLYGVSELVRVFAFEFGRLGDVDLLDNMLERLGDTEVETVMALTGFAEGVVPIAEPDDAREFLVIAADVARAMERRNPYRTIAFDLVIHAAAACGHHDLAMTIVDEQHYRSTTPADVIDAFVGAGGAPDIALEIADSVADNYEQAAALVAAALATPDRARAGELLARIDRLIAENVDLSGTAMHLASVAAGHSRRDAALRLARQTEQFAARKRDDGVRRYLMARVVRLMSSIHAEHTPSQLAWVESAVEWLAQQPPLTMMKYSVLEALAAVLPVVDADRAQRILVHLVTDAIPAMVSEIDEVARDVGVGELMVGIPVPAEEPVSGAWEAIRAARALVESGARDEAESLLLAAERDVGSEQDPLAAVEIACALGDRRRAAAIAQEVSNWPVRREALHLVARSMLSAGEPDAARPLVVRLLAALDLKALDLVADADPDSVPVLVGEFDEIVGYLDGR